MAEREGAEMETSLPHSGIVQKMWQYSHGNIPSDFQRILLAAKKVSVFSEMLYCSGVYSPSTKEPTVVLPGQNEPGKVSGLIPCITRTQIQNVQNPLLSRKEKKTRKAK